MSVSSRVSNEGLRKVHKELTIMVKALVGAFFLIWNICKPSFNLCLKPQYQVCPRPHPMLGHESCQLECWGVRWGPTWARDRGGKLQYQYGGDSISYISSIYQLLINIIHILWEYEALYLVYSIYVVSISTYYLVSSIHDSYYLQCLVFMISSIYPVVFNCGAWWGSSGVRGERALLSSW